MPTRIVFVAPGVKGGVLTQVFVEEPNQVLDAFIATGTLIYLRMGASEIPGASLNTLMFFAWTVATIVIAIVLVLPAIGG